MRTAVLAWKASGVTRRRASRLLSVAAVCVGLSGCATLSKEECLSADWAAIGERDGAAGYEPQARFAGHTKACAKVSITPDRLAWNSGFDRGLARYCTPQNGLYVGQQGNSYQGVCPVETASAFLESYQVGFSAYTAQSELDSAKRDIESKQDELSDVLKGFAGLSQADQVKAQFEISELNRDIQGLQADLVQLSAEVARADAAVEAHRQRLLSGS
ncbi:MAG: DUF2799 domain-containing protein [Pseudomonadota bacterium]